MHVQRSGGYGSDCALFAAIGVVAARPLATVFAQGVFASCRILPRTVYLVAGFYLAAGSANFLLFREENALGPWTMALPFGLGQFLAASILYWTLERHDVVETET